MLSEQFVRWTGAAAMVGGLLWVISTVVHASKPVGCVAQECTSRQTRETSVIEGVLTLGALLLFAATACSLVLLVRSAGRFGTVGSVGTILALIGILVLVAAGAVQTVVLAGDFPLMPYFVIPGIVALVAGFVMLALLVLRSGVLPRWAAASLLIGALTMLGFNEQSAAAWLAIPFGLSWMVVGYALWTQEPRVHL